MITSSNSLCREWDAHSSAQASTSHHVRYRAVPRTNRTRTTANTHIHSVTSSTSEPPVSAPSLPWQCSCVDASPDECTGVSNQDEHAPLLAPPPPTRSATTNCPADVTQSLLASTGLLTRDHPHVCADLLAALKPRRSSDDQHVGQCRKRTDAGMSHQPHRLGSFPGFPF